MTNWNCRIGKVNMKDRRVTALPVRHREAMAQKLIEGAAAVIDCCDNDMRGFVCMAWGRDNLPYISWRIKTDEVPIYLLPTFVSEALRQDITDYRWEE